MTTVLWMTTVAPPTRAGATLPSPAGKVDRRIAETDEEVTYLQIPMLLKIFRKNWTLQKSDLLIHHYVVPLPRWGRLSVSATSPTNHNLKHIMPPCDEQRRTTTVPRYPPAGATRCRCSPAATRSKFKHIYTDKFYKFPKI